MYLDEKDKIFFTYYSKFQLQYYQKVSKIDFHNNTASYGNYGNYEDSYDFIKEVSSMNGRVWFVFSDFIYEDRDLMNFMEEHFEDKNHKLLQKYHTVGASVLLYEIQPK